MRSLNTKAVDTAQARNVVTPPKTPKWSIRPTPEQIAAFTGMHCRQKYLKAVKMGWRCPSCDRTAQELIRWTYINGAWFRKHYGDAHGMAWSVAIVTHHCHGRGRFNPVLLCGDCNSADGAVKRKLGLPASWSFSPEEIAQFTTVKPFSGETIIDYRTARLLYLELNFPEADLFA